MRVISDAAERPEAPFRATAVAAAFGTGFYDEEIEDLDGFRWMGSTAVLEVPDGPGERFLELWAFSSFHDLSQGLTLSSGESSRVLSLPHGWTRLSAPIDAGASRVLLDVDRLFPRSYYPDDPRNLAIRVRSPYVHADPERHREIVRQHENAVLNRREMLAGAKVLESTPPHLGIDLHGVCNVKPPCVYCEWDWSKEQEGANVDTPFTHETLREYGAFFDNSIDLINCSIGEPFMMKNLNELFDTFGDRGKVLEMTTNGQILTDRNIDRLLGRDIDLYISLDAATPETYARLRNDRLDDIQVNLRRLIAAKGGREGRPRIHLVFMPMQCNVHELDGFVELCADLGVDRMVLRPLNYSDSIDLDWEREGYHFSYQDELLPFDEIVRVSARAAELCAERGVPLSDQMDFGGPMGEVFHLDEPPGAADAELDGNGGAPSESQPVPLESQPVPTKPPAEPSTSPEPTVATEPEEAASLGEERLPACHEPWTSLYILRRGVLPCCYGGAPIADIDGHQDAWNSEINQEIRAELAAGRFHNYCLDSPSCPIVQKSLHSDDMPLGQASFLKARELWHKIDRGLGGAPGMVLKPVKKLVLRLWPSVHAR